MSKKKFTNGLDTLFVGAVVGSNQDASDASAVFLGRAKLTAVKATAEADEAVVAAPSRRSASLKNFASDLEHLLQDAFQESIAEQRQRQEAPSQNESMFIKRPVLRKPVSGLDFVIRETIANSDFDPHDAFMKKRITLAFDNDQLEKLKSIARVEKAFLKDIVSQLVAEYISDYEQKKGAMN